jgi:hypothetical protein
LSGLSSSESQEGGSDVKSKLLILLSYLTGLPVFDFLILLVVVTVVVAVLVALAPSFFIYQKIY